MVQKYSRDYISTPEKRLREELERAAAAVEKKKPLKHDTTLLRRWMDDDRVISAAFFLFSNAPVCNKEALRVSS